MGVAVGEVGEGDSSAAGRGARGAKPGGGGTQPQVRPSTKLVERPGRREETPAGLGSAGFRPQSPEGSVPPWSDGGSMFSDRRLCGNSDWLGHPKMQGDARPSRARRACQSGLWAPCRSPTLPRANPGFPEPND